MTLIINNYLNRTDISHLLHVIRPFSEYRVVAFTDVPEDFEPENETDAIVLTGSEARLAKDRVTLYNVVAQMIRTTISRTIANTDRPILGICFGHQLGCAAFGAQIGALPKAVKDTFEKVTILEPVDIFEGFKEGETVPFAEFHNDYVRPRGLASSGLKVLAKSPSCETEAVKHTSKPFYGVQFHAERTRIGAERHKFGLRVIENFFRVCCRR